MHTVLNRNLEIVFKCRTWHTICQSLQGVQKHSGKRTACHTLTATKVLIKFLMAYLKHAPEESVTALIPENCHLCHTLMPSKEGTCASTFTLLLVDSNGYTHPQCLWCSSISTSWEKKQENLSNWYQMTKFSDSKAQRGLEQGEWYHWGEGCMGIVWWVGESHMWQLSEGDPKDETRWMAFNCWWWTPDNFNF